MPFCPSKVPVQSPVASRVMSSPVQLMPVPSTSEQSNESEPFVRVIPSSPVKRPWIYAGVSAVVDAAAAFQLALPAVTVLYAVFQLVVEAVSGML